MSARKTALELGYKNLYDYCVARLNLSEGAVPARIHVANVSRRFPQLLVALAERRICLTVAGLLAPHVSDDNVDKLIADCAGNIASEVSERVHARAGYQCQYRASDGTRCSARTGFQIEHVRPFGIFRSNDERFLKLLCAQHNALAVDRVYGAAFIQRKIDERRAVPTSRRFLEQL